MRGDDRGDDKKIIRKKEVHDYEKDAAASAQRLSRVFNSIRFYASSRHFVSRTRRS